MGLDMYLVRRTYVSHSPCDHHRGGEGACVYSSLPAPWLAGGIKARRVRAVEEEVGYWRKANAIHRWFVENCQGGVDDCRHAEVSLDDLRSLLATCREVLANPTKASELLPTQEGFFFGSIEYGSYYMEDVRLTIYILEGVLAEHAANGDISEDYRYHSSW